MTGVPAPTADYPVHPDGLPAAPAEERKYRIDFARTPAELQAIQRLRFEVFNVELGEGLAESWRSGLDCDRFDAVCHHLLVTHAPTGEIVGTYRMQTAEMAARHAGFYSADEFTIDSLPAEVVAASVEVGRACVAREHRNRQVLFLLWRGLARYLAHNAKRYVFGCCSLTSQDPAEGKRVMDFLERAGHVHRTLSVRPQPGWECYPPGFTAAPLGAAIDVPKLFGLYLRYGSKVCGEPALDPYFKTIDYLVVFDTSDLDADSRRTFFG